MQAIGAGALNQAVKAVAIARGFVAPSGIDLICIPAFSEIMINGEERTLPLQNSDWILLILLILPLTFSPFSFTIQLSKFVAPSGIDLICIPAFSEIMINGEERTAIKLIVEPR